MKISVAIIAFVLCVGVTSFAQMHEPLLSGFHCADVKPKKVKYVIGVCVRTDTACETMRGEQRREGHRVSECRVAKEAYCFEIAHPEHQRSDERCYTTASTCKIQRKGARQTRREHRVVIGECHRTK